MIYLVVMIKSKSYPLYFNFFRGKKRENISIKKTKTKNLVEKLLYWVEVRYFFIA